MKTIEVAATTMDRGVVIIIITIKAVAEVEAETSHRVVVEPDARDLTLETSNYSDPSSTRRIGIEVKQTSNKVNQINLNNNNTNESVFIQGFFTKHYQ